MRKIALVLVLFQLIGCAKYPDVTTHPEKKQEHETLKDDTPQAPKTNYLKIGAYTGGVILTIFASIGLIAYCCRQKEEEVHDELFSDSDDELLTDPEKRAKKREKQDTDDIDKIVPKVSLEMRNNYPAMVTPILQVYTNHPEYRGEPKLEAILKWHFLQRAPVIYSGKSVETNLCRQREYVKWKVKEEVRQARRNAPPGTRMTELFTTIEASSVCLLNTIRDGLALDLQNLQVSGKDAPLTTAPSAMNFIARIVYYYVFQNALIENEDKK